MIVYIVSCFITYGFLKYGCENDVKGACDTPTILCYIPVINTALSLVGILGAVKGLFTYPFK